MLIFFGLVCSPSACGLCADIASGQPESTAWQIPQKAVYLLSQVLRSTAFSSGLLALGFQRFILAFRGASQLSRSAYSLYLLFTCYQSNYSTSGASLAFTLESFKSFKRAYYRFTCFISFHPVSRLFTLPAYYLFNCQVASNVFGGRLLSAPYFMYFQVFCFRLLFPVAFGLVLFFLYIV